MRCQQLIDSQKTVPELRGWGSFPPRSMEGLIWLLHPGQKPPTGLRHLPFGVVNAGQTWQPWLIPDIWVERAWIHKSILKREPIKWVLTEATFKNPTSTLPLRYSPHGDSLMKEKRNKTLTSLQEHTRTTLSSHNPTDEVKYPLTTVIHDHVPLEQTPHQWNQSASGRLCHTPEKPQISVGVWPPRLYDFSF